MESSVKAASFGMARRYMSDVGVCSDKHDSIRLDGSVEPLYVNSITRQLTWVARTEDEGWKLCLILVPRIRIRSSVGLAGSLVLVCGAVLYEFDRPASPRSLCV